MWSAAGPQSTVSVSVMSAAGTLISPVEMVVMLVRMCQCQLMGCPPCWCKPLACQLLRSEFIFIDMGPHRVAHVGPKLMILLPQPLGAKTHFDEVLLSNPALCTCYTGSLPTGLQLYPVAILRKLT